MQGKLEDLKLLLSVFAQEEPVLQKILQKGEVGKLADYTVLKANSVKCIELDM